MVRIACIGGFLGAGKTTALIEAAQKLMARGLTVGVITNDQGSNLVDTALTREGGLQTEEITGGCFCCRFPEFVKHASRLVERHHPDILLAEAVGSCTDLAATVYGPLRRFHAGDFELAPLSVFVEPIRMQEFQISSCRFEESVRYLFKKQLAEAELVVLSKTDLAEPAKLEDLKAQIRQLAGDVPVIPMSAKIGHGVNEWVERLLRERSAGEKQLDLDYEIYGQAEASLGWLNATLDLTSGSYFSPSDLGEAMISKIQEQCAMADKPIAHVKIILITSQGSDRIALTSRAGVPAWDGDVDLGLAKEASVIINARVAANPGVLRRIVEEAAYSAARAHGVAATVMDLESFAPAPPKRPVWQPAN